MVLFWQINEDVGCETCLELGENQGKTLQSKLAAGNKNTMLDVNIFRSSEILSLRFEVTYRFLLGLLRCFFANCMPISPTPQLLNPSEFCKKNLLML